MMTVIISWESAHLYGEAWISHHRLRHQIFVDRQSWNIPTYNGLEYDEFDTPSARYVLWIDSAGRARGVARLLPTTRPYMVKSLWPDLLQRELPETETIWEATRFGCDQSLDPATRRRVVTELICGCLEFGLTNGIHQYLSVMPVAVLTHIIANAGCKIAIQAPRFRMGRHDVAAAYLDVSPAILAEVRARAGIRHPVLNPPIHIQSRHEPAVTARVRAR